MRKTEKKRMQALFLALILEISLLASYGTVQNANAKQAITVNQIQKTATDLKNPTISENGEISTWDCIWFGNYYQSDADGKLKDPIKWRVLSINGEDAFLFADNAMEMDAFCEADEDKIPTDHLNWGISTVRSYLNGYEATENIMKKDYSKDNFIDVAFTKEEQNAILVTNVNPDENTDRHSDQGKETKDKLFLLSALEASDKKLGFCNGDARRYYNTTNYAFMGGRGKEKVGVDQEMGYAWWTRTMGGEYSQQYIYSVAIGLWGNVELQGAYAASPGFGIRPAMHLDLSKAEGKWSYAGTVNSDGTMKEENAKTPVVTKIPDSSIAPTATPEVTETPTATPTLDTTVTPPTTVSPTLTETVTPTPTVSPTLTATITATSTSDPTVTPTAEPYSNNNTLPIMNISIDESKGSIENMNNDGNHDTKCYGNISFTIPDNYQSEYGKLGIKNGESLEMSHIKGRGNATWHCNKKPYKIKLKEKADLFGMGSSKHWVLISNSYEFTYMKNKMLYDLADKIGLKYSPQSVYVDVVMNGEYLGNYLLCEQVRVEKSRVNIDDLEGETDKIGQDTAETNITGGYLVKLDSYAVMDSINFRTKERRSYGFESPSFEDGLNEKNQTQYDYITDYLQRMEDAVYSEKFINEKGEHYTDLMDLDSFADYFLIQFFSDNFDAFYNSTFMYKERNGKLYWGPVWDFDHSMNGEDTTETSVIDGISRYMVKQILTDPEAAKRINEHYQKIRSTLFSLYEDNGYIDQMVKKIKISRENDMTKWQPTYKNYYDFDAEIKTWKTWMQNRIKFMDTYLPSLIKEHNTVYLDAADGTDIKEIYATKGYTIALPDAPMREGYEFEGWYYMEDGKERLFTKDIQIDEDMTITAKWKQKMEIKNGNNEKKDLTVTLDAQGGIFKDIESEGYITDITISVTEGSTIHLPVAVKRYGYIFTGWYTERMKGSKVSSKSKILTDTTFYAHWSKVKTPKGKISKLKNKKSKKLTITIAKVSGAKGYEILYAEKSTFKNAKKKTGTTLSYTISNLKKGKTYYVKVRAYKKDSTGEKIYGKYSAVKKIKISK